MQSLHSQPNSQYYQNVVFISKHASEQCKKTETICNATSIKKHDVLWSVNICKMWWFVSVCLSTVDKNNFQQHPCRARTHQTDGLHRTNLNINPYAENVASVICTREGMTSISIFGIQLTVRKRQNETGRKKQQKKVDTKIQTTLSTAPPTCLRKWLI